MTPEERAVVQAAIRDYHAHPLSNILIQPGSLRAAVQALVYACHECNTDRHRCGGCGTDLQHGDNACKGCSIDNGFAPPYGREWQKSTFLHILEGDSLRIGQDTAVVIGASALLWHAHVESKRMMSGKWWDTITPHDHIEVHCVLDINNSGEYTRLTIDPSTDVEILCDAERATLLTLQTAFPGTKEIKS